MARRSVFDKYINCLYANPNGIPGYCEICHTNKSTIVNGICLECQSPERQSKYLPEQHHQHVKHHH